MLALLALAVLPLIPGGKQPQLAADGATVALAYSDGKTLYAAVSTDGGDSFAAPYGIAGAAFMVGRHRGPRVVVKGRRIVVSAITDGMLVAWNSADGGRRWSEGAVINDVPKSAREGLHGMAIGPKGEIFAAWLDLRTPGMKVYGALSTDGGDSWSANRLVYASPDGNVCECCHPSVAIDARGRIHVMFRNWLGGARDLYLATSADRGLTFTAAKQGKGTWKLNACPMDGGGLAVGPAGPVTVWRREGKIYSGAELGEGKDPALAIDPAGKPVFGWTRAGEVILDGESMGPGGFLSLAAGDGVVAAWEAPDGIRVQRLRRLP
jgi:hypothetical protein